MSPHVFVKHCHSHGITLTPLTDELHVRASVRVPETIRAELVRLKPELLTTGVRAYARILEEWTPQHAHDLPPAPLFDGPSAEHALAWSAFWTSVEARNRKFTL